MVAVREIRAAGRDVRVARYGATPHCVYAMFCGRRARLVRGRGQARALIPSAGRARARARSLRSLLPLGRSAGEERRRSVAHRRAARRRSALSGARRRDRQLALATPASDRPVTAREPAGPAIRPRRSRSRRPVNGRRSGIPRALARVARDLATTARHDGLLQASSLRPGVSAKGYKSDLVANADFRKFDEAAHDARLLGGLRRRARGATRRGRGLSPTGARSARRPRR